MGAAIPCLGYPSRTAAVVALRAQGLTTREISQRVGIELKTVTALEGSMTRLDRQQQRAPKASASGVNTVVMDSDTLRALRPHAARRGVTVVALAQQLLATLVDDDLVNALLDDEAELRDQ